MDWYRSHYFGDKVEAIEQYFVFLAANEGDIRVYGWRTALQAPGADEALKALASFGEDFATFKQDAARLGKAFTQSLGRRRRCPRDRDAVGRLSARNEPIPRNCYQPGTR